MKVDIRVMFSDNKARKWNAKLSLFMSAKLSTGDIMAPEMTHANEMIQILK